MLNPFLHSEMNSKKKNSDSCKFVSPVFGKKIHFVEQLANIVHFKHHGIYFAHHPVGSFMKYPILNISSASPPPSHFFPSMQLVSFNGNNSLCKNRRNFH
jgi:hypothetical protein